MCHIIVSFVVKQACKVDCKKMETDMASGKIKLEDLKVVPTYCLLFFKDDIKCKDKSDNKLQDILDKVTFKHLQTLFEAKKQYFYETMKQFG